MTCWCVPVMALVSVALLVALVLLAMGADWFQRSYERVRRQPAAEKPPAWHAHHYVVPRGLEGSGTAKCDCGALAAVYVGGQG